MHQLDACTGDHLEATCDFETKGTNHVVSAGGSHHNEMCNLYFMMWSELPVFLTCFNNGPSFERHGPGELGTDSSDCQPAACPGSEPLSAPEGEIFSWRAVMVLSLVVELCFRCGTAAVQLLMHLPAVHHPLR